MSSSLSLARHALVIEIKHRLGWLCLAPDDLRTSRLRSMGFIRSTDLTAAAENDASPETLELGFRQPQAVVKIRNFLFECPLGLVTFFREGVQRVSESVIKSS